MGNKTDLGVVDLLQVCSASLHTPSSIFVLMMEPLELQLIMGLWEYIHDLPTSILETGSESFRFTLEKTYDVNFMWTST